MRKSYEIAETPEILIDKDFDYKLIRLEGLKLGDSYKKLNLSDVVGVYVCDYKEPYANFAKQIEQFKKHDGWVHMAGKFTFGIKDQKISEIKLSGKYIENLPRLNVKMIIEIHGEPNKILTDSVTYVFDYVEYAKILAYSDKKLYFYIDTETKRVNEIRIGDVDKKIMNILSNTNH